LKKQGREIVPRESLEQQGKRVVFEFAGVTGKHALWLYPLLRKGSSFASMPTQAKPFGKVGQDG